MKALKEKRLSLRSFLRRGLVILSLFALAFALASCGESGSGDDTTTGGTTTPTAAPLPKVVSIKILAQPKNASFQGCPPNISDVKIEVLYDNSPNVKTYEGDEIRANGLYPSPDYCDTPGIGDDQIGRFFIAAYSGGAKSQKLEIPGVIPLASAEVTGGAPVKVYADQKPDFSKVTVKGRYLYEYVLGVDDDGNPVVDDSTWAAMCLTTAPATVTKENGKIEYHDIPVTFGVYPPIVMDSGAVASGVAKVYIGANFASNPAVDGSTLSPSITQTNKIDVDVDVNFYQLSGIVFKSFGGEGFVYDDDVDLYVNDDKDQNFANLDEIDKLLKGSMFTVRYETRGALPDPDPDGPKDISWETFQERVKYALETYGSGFVEYSLANVIVGTDGKLAGGKPGDPTPVFNWNDDEGDPIWAINLQYVPKEYAGGTSPNSSYTGYVDVDVPVFTFDQTIKVGRRDNAPEPLTIVHEWKSAPVSFPPTLEDSIRDRWQLSATYRRGSEAKDKTKIALASAYFAAGVSGRTNAAGVKVEKPNIDLIGTQAFSRSVDLNYTPGNASTTQTLRDWPLPLSYRGTVVTDDETVNIYLKKDLH